MKYFLLILFFLYGLLINSYYRPYIFKNNINDFGIADIGNNIIFIPAVYIFLHIIKTKFILINIKILYFIS